MDKYNEDFIQYSEKKVKNETKHLALYFVVHITLYIVLLFFLIFFVWYTVFISTHRFYAVAGPSMKYTLNRNISDNDRTTADDAVYVDKISTPNLFDIIVIEEPNEESKIKRLMAVEGDYITVAKEGDYFYFYRIPSGADLSTFSDEEAKMIETTGENGYQIRGYEDWREFRTASSLIEVEAGGETKSNQYENNFYNIFLRAFVDNDFQSNGFNYHISENGLIYVQVPEGQFFYMGDNRGHSTDARENGFCDWEYIVGRAEFIVYDYNFGNRIWEVIKFYFSEMEKFFAR